MQNVMIQRSTGKIEMKKSIKKTLKHYKDTVETCT